MRTRLILSILISCSLLAMGAVMLTYAQGVAPDMAAEPIGNVFTYQGSLAQNGAAVNGACDARFALWSASAGGTQIGETQTQASLAVSNGLFTTLLDFGPGAFAGEARWLEFSVRCPAGSGSYESLSPRQQLTAVPYAVYAKSAPWGSLAGMPAGFADGVDNSTRVIAGAGLTSSTSADVVTLTVTFQGSGSASTVSRSDHLHNTSYWKVDGNGNTTPGTHFLGTTDNKALELKVNNQRGLRIEPTDGTVNVIGGHSANVVAWNAYGAAIGGGGSASAPNRVFDLYGVVGGGRSNTAGTDDENPSTAHYSTVSGGQDNIAGGPSSTVAGGTNNRATLEESTVGGGGFNRAAGGAATVAGGHDNQAWQAWSTVSGGQENHADGTGSTVGGGESNIAKGWVASISGGWDNRAAGDAASTGGGATNAATGNYSVVGGGSHNVAQAITATIGGGEYISVTGKAGTVSGGSHITVTGDFAAVGGGAGNIASGYAAVVSGGGGKAIEGGAAPNVASGSWSVVGGGGKNTASGNDSTVSGGWTNTAGAYATVGGGLGNNAAGQSTVIGGGNWNSAIGNMSTVGGGESNSTSGWYGTVAGGYQNSASGYAASVTGGFSNTAGGAYSYAGGRRAKAPNDGSFVWGDSTNADIRAATSNTFVVRANGGIWFGKATSDAAPIIGASTFISTSTGAYLSAGGAWTNASDRGLKDNFAPLTGSDLLRKLAAVEISTWNYKAEDPSIRHMGPSAQDFYGAFGLGGDRAHISTVDADGVALATIQALYELSQEQAVRITDLEGRLAELEALVNQLVQQKVTGSQ